MGAVIKAITIVLLLVATSFGQVIEIDGTSTPIYLDQPDATYRLMADVVADGTAFGVIADNVTLELNGHTITYDDSQSLNPANGSFETPEGWALSAKAVIAPGDYLSNEVHLGSQSLQFDTPCPDQVVMSTASISLPANTSLALSAMIWRGNGKKFDSVNCYVELVGRNGEPTIRVQRNTGNKRGIQFCSKRFNTGPNGGEYDVRVGVDGCEAIEPLKICVDDIRISRIYAYGIATPVKQSAAERYPGLDRYGSAENFRLIGPGKIIQGQDNGVSCHGLYVYQKGAFRLDVAGITVAGPDCKCIEVQSSAPAVVNGCTLESNVVTITSRDQFDGSMIGNNFDGVVSNCLFLNGPHSGIRTTAAAPSLIVGNTFRMKNRFTNGFAIAARGNGTRVYRNAIENVGDYCGRGIQIAGPSTVDMEVFENVVHVETKPINQEYGSLIAYGIQCEACDGATIRNNYVVAYGREGQASAFRANNQPTKTTVRDNVFIAIQETLGVETQSVQFTNVHDTLGNGCEYRGNTLRSNKNFVGETDNCTGVVWSDTTFEALEPSPDARWWESVIGTNPSQRIEWKWIDNVYAASVERGIVEALHWRRVTRNQYDPFSTTEIAWTVNGSERLQLRASGSGFANTPQIIETFNPQSFDGFEMNIEQKTEVK